MFESAMPVATISLGNRGSPVVQSVVENNPILISTLL